MDNNYLQLLIKKYSGIPYKHAGRDLNGLDCLGLVHFFYQDCGIKVPDGDGKEYSLLWYQKDPERYLRGILEIGTEVSVEDLQPLDFVYFKLGKCVSHGGIMIDSEHFIHVLQKGVVHISQLDRSWQRRLVGARRPFSYYRLH